ncbi:MULTISPECIES: M20 family metallo-hydrolase [unclassified Rhizobium]|uniref:M20 family metallo-hydrolase n=1 Tax=unclassified Rhizobium TaxID=2613769 RepID=UPI0006F2953B|nr:MULTISPECIES: M20 family metallo-hydrolase [unclassified Rhizobium]KQV33559.1 Zn-dependent hydrolase [Rhizobium sp. Root1212]KRD23103.1 Zn-dependent hydrolase [Rhizobium sp. Root268]
MTATPLSVDGDRLWADILSTARIGAYGETGMNRLALSASDGEVRGWFEAECRALGCTVEVDAIGNMFAILPGTEPGLAAIAVGSHLDTQPAGGRFDGILGVLAGVEILRVLHASGERLRHPFTVINWTNEEGSRFSPAMMGSGVFCGVHDIETIYARADKEGVTVGEALEAIGYRGPHAPGHLPMAAYLELHIEQGPVLEADGSAVGVLSGVQGLRWLDVRIRGTEAHAGAFPMNLREDALVSAAKVVLATQAVALNHPPGVATVGYIHAGPNSRNVVPGEVRLEIDMRHPEEEGLAAMETKLTAEIGRLVPGAEVSVVWRKAPVAFDAALRGAIRQEAEGLSLSAIDMVSGAGHDAAHVAGKVPTAMIFIPSREGLSHNEREYSSPQQCADGANLLLRSVLRADQLS